MDPKLSEEDQWCFCSYRPEDCNIHGDCWWHEPDCQCSKCKAADEWYKKKHVKELDDALMQLWRCCPSYDQKAVLPTNIKIIKEATGYLEELERLRATSVLKDIRRRRELSK